MSDPKANCIHSTDHCWHVRGEKHCYLTYPPSYSWMEVCCWCSVLRKVEAHSVAEEGHGPYGDRIYHLRETVVE